MSDVPLPLDRFSSETYLTALEDLVNRYVQDEEPVHYKKAAINLNETTTSSCLRYFSDINLIEAEKAGVYTPSNPVIDYFRKVGDSKKRAKKEIGGILKEYDLFSEVVFLVETGDFDLDALSTKTAGQLNFDKNNVSSVSKAIEIFSKLGFIELGGTEGDSILLSSNSHENSGIGSKQNPSPEPNESESDESESVQQSLSGSLDAQQDTDVDFPPTRGGPDALLELVQELSEGGTHSNEDITESLNVSKRKVQGTTQYARALGFVEEREDGYVLTDAGYELAFTSEEPDIETLFQESVRQYPSYRHIIQATLAVLNDEAESIDSPTIRKELRTTFGFRENKDATLRDAINTLLKTLESAGLGEYIIGRGGASTRLEVSSEELQSLCNLVSQQPHESGDTKGGEDTSENQNAGNEEIDEVNEKANKEADLDAKTSSIERRGPAIRISEIRIQNFRNIRDTGFIELENVTTLIGKNESGKTSTLEAINSFSGNYSYSDRDLSNSTGATKDNQIPIVTLRFELTKQLVDEFYPQIPDGTEFPLLITRTKFFDGSYESHIEADIDSDEVELPTPNILYYDSYDLISDKASIEQLNNGERSTFHNLLSLGGISVDDFDGSPLTQYNTIEQAENRIEDKLNNAWSQKSLNVNLNWVDSEQTIHLLIQDELNPESAVDERPLTYPSQRSEGFQWFLSFYINLLAETNGTGLESKVLLLDDPAVYLHPEGKRDWLESVNDIGKNEQVVFSSHSPYLIDKRYPSRIRAVEDTPRGGTKIREDIFESDSHTLEPLRNALGVDLGSSPFISRRQLLVEGPTEYYVVAAVANYFSQVLDRDLFGWQEVSVMPVRGASNVVGQASWLESEGIDYAIMLDSDQAGRDVRDRIRTHNPDIDSDRVVLLQNTSNSEGVVTEDLFGTELYVSEFNAEYKDFTSELDGEFEPVSVEDGEGLSCEIGGIEYDGSRLDQVLVEYLEGTEVSVGVQNSRGEIELRKRQIAERIASRLNRSGVNENQLKSFNRLFARIDDAMNPEQ
ncbi:AAA family ATPase [Haloferax larsenii]|uniref:Predicted ATP-dependent endonuclease of the OLD family, contains P-loop ATPase and TOPRIM domains n=1 Tax=Haloferax larsenii TaxID=302484 RepID=A0A1H7TUG5_HALLR|nr:AAA family ATPase [Haloferax larsenii]SEL88159.1 Predicted ATP-dependent endonuclease of the OLD family, contains P-loop ATPase and TOPRIM domains [Haloferax larsenii]